MLDCHFKVLTPSHVHNLPPHTSTKYYNLFTIYIYLINSVCPTNCRPGASMRPLVYNMIRYINMLDCHFNVHISTRIILYEL